MTEKASIVLADSALTPESPGTPGIANRTFVPGEVENGNVHTFYENTTGNTAATRSKMTIALLPSDVVHRFKISFALPQAQTVDGIVKSAHITRANLELLLPVNGTRDDRRDIRVMLANAITGDAGVKAAIDDLENLW